MALPGAGKGRARKTGLVSLEPPEPRGSAAGRHPPSGPRLIKGHDRAKVLWGLLLQLLGGGASGGTLDRLGWCPTPRL